MPLLAKVGNTIFVILGLATLYILQKVSSSKDTVVIKPYYVQGVINKEVVSFTF